MTTSPQRSIEINALIRRFFFVVGLFAFTASFACLGGAQTVNPYDSASSKAREVSFVSPPQIYPASNSTDLVLQVQKATNTFNGIPLQHRSYNGNLVGPTIRLRPGAQLRIRLENHLEPEPISVHGRNNPWHGLNTTNLHTHGLHVSPKPPADDVFREILPGASCDYLYDIPTDHPSGTFWYHAHKHGSTALQLASGMAGALIVEGGLDDVPEIKAAREYVMVLQQFMITEIGGQTAIVDPNTIYPSPTILPQIAINGQVCPTIVMRPGEVQRWRLIHAGIADQIPLQLDGFTFHEIAVDGLALGTSVERTELQLFPGYRSDVLVKAPQVSDIYMLRSQISDPKKSIRKTTTSQSNVLRVVVTGTPFDMPLPEPAKLKSFATLSDSDVPSDGQLSNTRQVTFNFGNPPSMPHAINDMPFDPSVTPFQPKVGTAEQWELNAPGHPFHVHVNPFAVPVPQGDPNPNRWVWRDTYFSIDDSTTLRMWFRAFDGKTVMHCHILDHEDQGMMQAIEIMPQTVARWELPDASGNLVSSDSSDGQSTLLILHRGLECEHCAGQLKDLAQRGLEFKDSQVRLIAISPVLPADSLQLSFKSLGKFEFPMLLDRDKQVFKRFGCLDRDGDPLHGAFMITSDYRVLKQIVGPEPATTDEITSLLRIAKQYRISTTK
jgi:FtsP/CotA-like multicopper oxidase with cupredoxin domain/peroxiredoxin